MKIVRLSELSEEKKNLLESQYNQLLEAGVFMNPNQEFNVYGLRFPIEYLRNVRNYVCILPLEYIAEYVDVITKERIDYESDIQDDFYDYKTYELEDCDLDLVNTTSIGNLAYACLHSKHKKTRQTCEESLNKILAHYEPQKLEVFNNFNI